MDGECEDHSVGRPHDEALEVDRVVHNAVHQAGVDVTDIIKKQKTITLHRPPFGFTKRGDQDVPSPSHDD